jgi:hypothetical protein
VLPSFSSRDSPSRRTGDEPDSHQERFDHRLDGLRLLADRYSKSVEPDWAPVETGKDDVHHSSVETVEAKGVDVIQFERRVYRGEVAGYSR